ncbi:MAG: glycoside hydrolase family 88 protein [Clostridia bacterium]|nr:glycoside hydrolase family 88 protein [Clostridia bacterium]
MADIDVPERFKQAYTIDREKLEGAAEAAIEKLKAFVTQNGTGFLGTASTDYKYTSSANSNWVCGMYTGTYLMAYQLTGDSRFKTIVESHIDTYVERVNKKVGLDDHDVGFVFMPSCVGAYKVFGNESAREAALKAVEYYYGTSYSKEGKFIIRSHRSWENGSGCRTMIDSLMNASLLFWSGEALGNSDYFNAAHDHNLTTVDLIVRDDGSTYHHYQFDPETAQPLYGLTWQGYSDESCWSRGHSWGIYGFSIAHSYTKDTAIMNAQRDITYYMLNHLPDDLIPYWDYTFISGSEPRDSSAAAIAVCGMLDMAEQLPEGSAQRTVYESAAAQIMEALIDECTTDIGIEYDGLIHSVTHGKPQTLAVGECAPYADYFYLEALARFLNEDFIRPW